MDYSTLGSLSITSSQSLPKLVSIEAVMPSNHLILCHPLLFPPSIFPSIRVFSKESIGHIRWPKYRSFNFSISPSNEYSGLISFRMDWLDLLAVQGTLKSLLQHYSPKASILWHSTFFIVQLSHPYMTTGKTIALTRWTFPFPVFPVFLPYRTMRHKATWGTADPSLHIWEQKSCLSLDIVLVVIVSSRTQSIICSLWPQMQCVCACKCMRQFCCCTRILDYES